jgi:ComF family protein
MHFIVRPLCACCGAPFEIPVDDGSLCGACIADAPAFQHARAAMLYDDFSKRLVLGFKHGDRTHLVPTLATWMRRAADEFWHDVDCIVPVPLHRWRLYKRRFNQAAMLAHNLATTGGKTYIPDVLRRSRATPPQGRMNRKDREDNVKGAFAIHPKHKATLKDKNILLVDDVLTTGATVGACAQKLLQAGAKSVNVLTLSRVKGYL